MKRNNIFKICAVVFFIMLAMNCYASGSSNNNEGSCADGSCYTSLLPDLQQIEQEARICMSDDVGKRLVLELEQCRLVNKNIVNYYKTNVELNKQIELLNTEIELLNKKFEIADQLIKANEDLYKQKEKVLNEELDEAKKPRWTSMFLSGGIGAVLALLLVAI